MRGTQPRRELEFQYRSETFVIPSRWFFQQWLPSYRAVVQSRDPGFRHGLCNSVTDTLNMLWIPFRSDARGELSSFHALLGCYNLHRSDFESASYLFWSNGWGAPHKVFLYACQMIATYWEYANIEDVTGEDVSLQCSGFPEFLQDIVSARSDSRSGFNRSNPNIPDRCRITVNFRNAQNYPRVHEPLCNMDPWGGPDDEQAPSADCDSGNRPAPGNRGKIWEKGEPFWNSTRKCFSGSAGNTLADRCSGPDVDSSYGGAWNITLPPAGLYWRGVACDTLLYYARLCNDYSLDRLFHYGEVDEAMRYRQTAQRLSRYALHYILHVANTLIHEMGHTYRSDDYHCVNANRDDTPYCCFDIAAKAFSCRVRARLGIPVQQYDAVVGGDFSNPVSLNTSNTIHCSADRGVFQRLNYSCDTRNEGQSHQEAIVAITNRTCAVTTTPSSGDVQVNASALELCLSLCDQVSPTPADLAACRESCREARLPDPDDVEAKE